MSRTRDCEIPFFFNFLCENATPNFLKCNQTNILNQNIIWNIYFFQQWHIPIWLQVQPDEHSESEWHFRLFFLIFQKHIHQILFLIINTQSTIISQISMHCSNTWWNLTNKKIIIIFRSILKIHHILYTNQNTNYYLPGETAKS